MNLPSLISDHGYWVLAVGCLLEGQTVLVLAGFAARRGHLALTSVIAIAAVAGFLGGQFYFWLGRRQGPAVLTPDSTKTPAGALDCSQAGRGPAPGEFWSLTMTLPFSPGPVTLGLICTLGSSAWAIDYGTVISSTQVVASVPVTQRQCTEEQRVYPPRSSGAGALIGAIAGAAVGNSLGAGAGRAAATGLGMVAGSVIGDRVETEGTPAPTSIVQNCRTVTRLEQRTVGYDVVYEYQGVQRTARLAQDPGARVALEFTPVGSVPAPTRTAPPQAPVPATVVEYDESRPPPRVVYVQPGYYPAPVYAYGWPYPVVSGGLWIGPGRGWYGAYGGYGGRGGYHYYHRR